MSSQDEINQDAASRRRDVALRRACEGDLQASVSQTGGELLGFSVKLSQHDCLITLRAVFPGGRMIAFVGGDTLAGCLLKVPREARSNNLRWKADKYQK